MNKAPLHVIRDYLDAQAQYEADATDNLDVPAYEAIAALNDLESALKSTKRFEDCLRLRELADRQTLTKKDREDLSAIADHLHALLVSRIDTQYGEEKSLRSTNDVAHDIVRAAPHVEALVEEWFAIESAARKRLYDRLDRIRAAAESDADLEGTALRDFLVRETR